MQTRKISSGRGIAQARLSASHSQQGIVLFVALIVMVALSLAGLALVRSVDTTSSVTGNIAFRQAALLQANWAVEDAIAHLYASDTKLAAGDMINPTTDAAGQYYKATFDPATDSTKASQPALPSGIPDVLWKQGGAWPKALPTSPSDNSVKYVIQRMCTAAAAGADAKQSQCEMMQPKYSGGTLIGHIVPNEKPFPLYRVTVRVDGPNNSLAFVQAMIRG